MNPFLLTGVLCILLFAAVDVNAAEKVEPVLLNKMLQKVGALVQADIPKIRYLNFNFGPKTNFQQRVGNFTLRSIFELDENNSKLLGDVDLKTDFEFHFSRKEEEAFATLVGTLTFRGDMIWVTNRLLAKFKEHCAQSPYGRPLLEPVVKFYDMRDARMTIFCREAAKWTNITSFNDVADLVLAFANINGVACSQYVNSLKITLAELPTNDAQREKIAAEIERWRLNRESFFSFKIDFRRDNPEGPLKGLLFTSPKSTYISLEAKRVALRHFYYRNGQFFINKNGFIFSFALEKRENLGFFFWWYRQALSRVLGKVQDGDPQAMQNLKDELKSFFEIN